MYVPWAPELADGTACGAPTKVQTHEAFKGKKVVGLTAGASAPEELVRHVIEALGEIEDVEVEQMDGKKEHIEFRLPAELRA